MFKFAPFLLLVVCSATLADQSADESQINWNLVFKCLHMKEASGKLSPDRGDDGKALGPYQIHEVYWKDALKGDPSIGGKYEDCSDKAYSEKVIKAYMRRWLVVSRVGKVMTYELICRSHNGGGPRAWPKHPGHMRWLQASQAYWESAVFDPLRK